MNNVLIIITIVTNEQLKITSKLRIKNVLKLVEAHQICRKILNGIIRKCLLETELK